MRAWLGLVVLIGCAGGADDDDGTDTDAGGVRLEGFAQVVPGPGLPPEIVPRAANNNLSIARFEGRLWLAWRSAPSHFASPDTELFVASSADEVTWRFEGRFALGTDLREPHLVPADDDLWLYFSKLGKNLVDFEPGGVLRTKRLGDGAWSDPEPWGPEGMVLWRVDRLADGRWHAFGYTGGAAEYGSVWEPMDVWWLASDDGVDFAAAHDDGIVLTGGGSETSAVLLDDGGVVAVTRSESGDPDGTHFGSQICTAPPASPGNWTCSVDPRKFDSPLLLRSGGKVWLIARRQVANDGRYDLGHVADWQTNHLDYLLAYSATPKRCALWEVDPATRAVTWVLDLPSRGDTCFPDAVEDGEDAFVVYNYSNDPDGAELTWFEGQSGETNLYRQRLVLR